MKFTRLFAAAFALLMLLSLCSCAKNEFHTQENLVGEFDVTEKDSVTLYYYLTDDNGAVMDICKNGKAKTAQTIEFPQKSDYYLVLDFEYSFAGVKLQDMNFDGALDLYVPCSVTSPNLEGMAWLWDTDIGTFVFSESLSRIPELKVDAANKQICGCDYSGAAPEYFVYSWIDSRLVKQ